MAKQKTVDFEKDHLLFEKALASPQYKKLISLVKKCKRIYLIGNGGLMDVSAHAAADLSRLVPNKVFRAFDSAGFLTSNANDFGFNQAFMRWMETTSIGIDNPGTTLVIGLSCSGNSANIIDALIYMEDKGYNIFLISGQNCSSVAISSKKELCYGTQYFHTTEVLVMKTMYDIVHKLGHHCPTIAAEQTRKQKPRVLFSVTENTPIKKH
jgi:phosphoheptose isomerase